MNTFTDIHGRTWTVALPREVRDEIKRCLQFDVLDGRQYQRFATDHNLLVNVLFIACEQQCRERNLTGQEFVNVLPNDSAQRLAQVFMRAAFDAMPKRQQRLLRKRGLEPVG